MAWPILHQPWYNISHTGKSLTPIIQRNISGFICMLRSIPFGLTPGSSPRGCPWIPSDLHDLEPPQGQCLWPWPSAPSWSVSSRMHASPWVPSRSRSLGLVSMSLGLTSIPTAANTLTPQLPQQVNSRTSKFLSSYYKRSPPLHGCLWICTHACMHSWLFQTLQICHQSHAPKATPADSVEVTLLLKLWRGEALPISELLIHKAATSSFTATCRAATHSMNSTELVSNAIYTCQLSAMRSIHAYNQTSFQEIR